MNLSSEFSFYVRLLAVAVMIFADVVVRAQTPAVLTDLGTNTPVPGAADISQLSNAGDSASPGLNYSTDSQTDHGTGEPGQTFTTGSYPARYTLTSLAIQTGGGTFSGLSTPKGYLLHIYSLSASGSNVTLIASYSATNFTYSDGDWLQWSGLSVSLEANSNYAYSFGKAAAGNGWDEMANTSSNFYGGGQIGLFPPAGGAINFGSYTNYDAVFDIGLTTDPNVGPVTAFPTNALYTGASVTLSAPVGGTLPIYYQWQTNGVDMDGATNSTLTLTNLTADNDAFYSLVVSNTFGSVGSFSNYVQVLPPSAPFFVTMASPQTQYVGGAVQFAATISGSPAAFIQWQRNGVDLADGGNISGSQTLSLSITNLALTNAATYALIVTNSFGAATNTVTLTVIPVGLAAVTNLPASNIGPAMMATLNGQVLATAGQTPVVTLYYGLTDGGTNEANWQQSLNLGQQGGNFSTTVGGLTADSDYFFTASASNSAGVAWASPSGTFSTPTAPPPVAVLTYHYDNTRQGANTNEITLTPANVNVNSFGRLFTYTVDGYVYTEPLIMTNVMIPGQGVHNVVFVATEHDSIYAFDADSNAGTNGGLLWHTNLGIAVSSYNDEFGNRYSGNYYGDIVPIVGITGTPVIDPDSGTLYVDVLTREVTSTTNYYHRIHALNITNGMEQPYSPVVVTASVPGTGVDSSNGVVTFNARQQNQRPGMTLAGGMLYVAYGSFADTDPYHGWVLGFNATNLVLQTNLVFNITPNATTAAFGANAGEGAIWMGGNGLSVDANTNLYFETGNGSFSANTNGGDYADSFVKLSTSNNLAVADYFTPYNQASLAASDSDLGSGGPLLLPDSVGSASHPHLIVGAGKQGTIYLVDRDNMGQYNAANDNQIVQEVPGAIGGVWSSPAYFNNQIYYQGSGDVMKAFLITNGFIAATPVSQSATSYGFPGATPTVSANGTNNGIAWSTDPGAYASSGPAVLHAYNATNLAQELYNSSQSIGRDNPGGAVKMTTPTVANGKVYVGAEYALSVYGTGLFATTPTISPGGGTFTNSVTVTLADTTPGVSIYYTLDGTTPTTSSTPYTGPFVLMNSASVQAIATAPGMVNSGVAGATFINSSAIGTGTGLLGQYWSNTTSAAFVSANFTNPPTLTRTDSVVNFNWNTVGPDPSVGQTVFAVRWTGSVQPQFNETYTFYATADDGVRLWVNGQELVNGWVDEAATTYQGTITLKAQQLYNIRMDYYQNGGGAVAQLQWSSPSTALQIIPQTQLYPFTNPPPTVVLASPAEGSTYTADASVTVSANADAPFNPISEVDFYTNNVLYGSLSNSPDAPLYTLTMTGLPAGSYALTAVATDGSGLSSTSAPVHITVNAGSGQPFGLTTNAPVSAFLNMPTTYDGTLPPLLSETGAFSDTTNRIPADGLIPYVPNTILWSDNAVKSRYMALPNNGGVITPDEQIQFAPTNSWTFPAGTVFVKNFDLVVNETNSAVPLRRLETRLLVRDINGTVYGVTYKWRPDDSDADLLSGSQTEDILITNASGVRTQTWYYPSPADCLTCHTPVANYVLGVNTRQLNGNETYPATGVTDNQLRTLNRLGLFNPAFDEADITNFDQMSALTNLAASLENRARSYLDANCSQCHQPGGTGITFDARYDTPLALQNITNYPAAFSLGISDNACIVKAQDIWRSVLLYRINTTNDLYKMPPLARSLVDTNAVQVFTGWINSLPGVPALAPPATTPDGGTFVSSVNVTLQPPDTNAMIYYTLDGSLPTTNSFLYSGALTLTNSQTTLMAAAFEEGHDNSIATGALFFVQPLSFTSAGFTGDNVFQMGFLGASGNTYVLEASTNLLDWTPISTNLATTNLFNLLDPDATNFQNRFYRVQQQ